MGQRCSPPVSLCGRLTIYRIFNNNTIHQLTEYMKLNLPKRFLAAIASAAFVVIGGIPQLEAADVSGVANTYYEVDAVNADNVTLNIYFKNQ